MSWQSSDSTGVALFTVESANRTLPLVRAIVGDLVGLYQKVMERRSRLDIINDERHPDEFGFNEPESLYAEELADIERQLEEDARELERFLNELDDLGIASRNGIHGVVSFPAMLAGVVGWRRLRLTSLTAPPAALARDQALADRDAIPACKEQRRTYNPGFVCEA